MPKRKPPMEFVDFIVDDYDSGDDSDYCPECGEEGYEVCMCKRKEAIAKLIRSAVAAGISDYEKKKAKLAAASTSTTVSKATSTEDDTRGNDDK